MAAMVARSSFAATKWSAYWTVSELEERTGAGRSESDRAWVSTTAASEGETTAGAGVTSAGDHCRYLGGITDLLHLRQHFDNRLWAFSALSCLIWKELIPNDDDHHTDGYTQCDGPNQTTAGFCSLPI